MVTGGPDVLAVIADGMGGLEDGGAASELAVRAFVDVYSRRNAAEPIREALARALEAANEKVCGFARERGLSEQIGTTLTAVVAHERGLDWISVGDSRAYLLRDGELSQITSDHVYRVELELAVAIGILDPEEAEADPQREALTSFVGLDPLPKIDRSLEPYPLRPGDLVLVCTDGVYKCAEGEDIVAALSDDPREVCERLMEAILARNDPQQDNATLVVLSCERGASRRRSRAGALYALMAALLVALALMEILAHTRATSRAPSSAGPAEDR